MRSIVWMFVAAIMLAGCGSCKDDPGGENNGANNDNSVTGETCDDVDCDADATCDDSGDAVECICKPGFEGDGFSCEEIVVACEQDAECGTEGTCTEGTCECADGYALQSDGCADIDECATATDDCDENASCSNTDGDFVCSCNAGWQGDGKTCSDFDECAADAHDCRGEHTACMNVEGGYECGCADGYTGDGETCSLLVDCNANPDACDANATCTDTPDGTACVCDEGFAGDGATCRQTGFTVLRPGNTHTCGLRRDGTMACWGMGSPLSAAGYVWQAALTEPTADMSGATWTYLGEGIGRTCAVLDDGTIWCGQGGELQQEGMDSDWERVASSTTVYQSFTCGIKTGGELWCWGNNELGQLGDGTTEVRDEPVQIPGTWDQVSLGSAHGCGVQSDGSVWCWGSNQREQLGNDAPADPATPFQIVDGTDWEWLQAVGFETCGMKAGGEVWCWGPRPLDEGPTRIGPTTWQDFTTNGTRQCGVRDDGTLWCKGTGLWGEHGSDQTNLLQLTQVGNADDWASVVTGFEHTCGLKESGEAWCWGHNTVGQIGIGSIGGYKLEPVHIAAGTSFQAADAGQAHGCAIAANGAMFCTGSNTIRQLGLGELTMTVHVQELTRIGNATNWATLSAGIQHTCAIRDDGSLWCTGGNTNGQLGLGEDNRAVGSFTRVGDQSDWANVAAGPSWTCALDADGALYCFGLNDGGQLGTGDTEQRWVPTRIGDDTYKRVDTHGYLTNSGHTCGIRKTDDTLWCWGENEDGQLGTGDEEPVLQPVQIGDATWSDVTTGGAYTCGIQTDGSLWCWGAPRLGALGLGQRPGAEVLQPTQVGSSTDWRDVSAAFQHTCATKEDGTAWCWGDLALVGAGVPAQGANTSTPVQVGTAADWAQLNADYTATWGIKTDGSIWTWGLNRDGQLGTGDAWYTSPQRVWD